MMQELEWQYIVLYFVSMVITGWMFWKCANEDKTLKKMQVLNGVLMTLSPGINTAMAALALICLYCEWEHTRNGEKEKAKRDAKEEREKRRAQEVYGFLLYKGHTMEELDEYVDSRSIVHKMIDKVE